MKGESKKPHFHVAAGLLWRRGKVLISRRPTGTHLEGLWEFPGGKRKEGESLEACLEREIKEELDLTVKAGERLQRVDHDYASKAISLHLFQCGDVRGEPRPLEGQEVKWVDPRELTRYSFPPPDKAIIDLLADGTEKRRESE